jgi:hypothetical protein
VVLRANTAQLEERRAEIERMELIEGEGALDYMLPSSQHEAKSGPYEIEGTARKAGAAAARINEVVIAMVQHGGNRAKAADACHMSPLTIWRLMKKPEFMAQYRKEQSGAYDRAMALLDHTKGMALSIMEHLRTDKNTPTSVQLQIIEFMLDFAEAGIAVDLQERFDVLTKARTERPQ